MLVAFVDELWSGVAVSGAPSVEHELALSHRGFVTFAFVLPLIVAAALEAGLALLSDVWGRERLVVFGQAALAAALFFTAWTTHPWGLTLGLAVAGAASGVACGAAQALLVASSRETADRQMVRWSLYCAMGDVVTPLVTALAIALGTSYRGAMCAIAVVACAQCAVSARLLAVQPQAAKSANADVPADFLRAALVRAMRLPRLWAWLVVAASCTLLDELVIALAALRLEHDHRTSAALATAAAVTFSAGSVLGAAITDGAVKRLSTRRVLVTSAILCAVSLGVLLAAGSMITSCAALFVLGLTCAPHHPLAMARAYEALPNRPGTVQAVAQVFVVVDVVAPLALGVAADRFGLGVAMGCLVVQPAIVLACALFLSDEGGLARRQRRLSNRE